MGDIPLLHLRTGITLCQNNFILAASKHPQGETGAGLLVREELRLRIVAPLNARVARQYSNLFRFVISHLR